MSTSTDETAQSAADPAGISGTAIRAGDRNFLGLSRGAGILVLAVMAAIAAFLVWKAIPSLQADSANFLTEQSWLPDQTPSVFGIAVLAFGIHVRDP